MFFGLDSRVKSKHGICQSMQACDSVSILWESECMLCDLSVLPTHAGMRFFFHSLGVPMHKPVICHMWQDSKATLFPTICIPKMPFKYDNIYVMRGGFYIFHDDYNDESEKKKWKQTDKMKSWGRKNRGRRDKWKEKMGEQITLLTGCLF